MDDATELLTLNRLGEFPPSAGRVRGLCPDVMQTCTVLGCFWDAVSFSLSKRRNKCGRGLINLIRAPRSHIG